MLVTVLLVLAMVCALLGVWPRLPQVSLLSAAVFFFLLTLVIDHAHLG